jgi:hypothetical protein
MKKLLLPFIALCVFAGFSARAADTSTPKTVIHIITVAWKEGTTPQQIQAALDGARKLPQSYKGVLRVWTKALKIQDAPGAQIKKSNVIVMEFANEEALKAYTDSDAQKEWYKVYLPIRQQSTTFDVTN